MERLGRITTQNQHYVSFYQGFQEIWDDRELGVGVIVGIDHLVVANSIPPSPLDLKYIVMWAKYGVGWEMPLRLEVISESR